MSQLKLLPGPVLQYRSFPDPKWREVQTTAHQFLHNNVEVDPEFTLADLFGLLEVDPVLKSVYRRDYANELAAEAAKGPLADDSSERLEYLELYQRWSVDSSKSLYSQTSHRSFHGVSPVLTEDRPEEYRKAGERIQYGVSLTPVRKLLTLPIRVNPEVGVSEDDIDSVNFMRGLPSLRREEITLGEFIHGVLWELSFHGAPEEAEELTNELREMVADIKEGPKTFTPAEDVFDELLGESREVQVAFVMASTGSAGAKELHAFLKKVPDGDSAAEALACTYGSAVQLKPEFARATGRELRVAMRTAPDQRKPKKG